MWLIVMKGLPGTGKSTLGRALSKQTGWPIIDKDDIKDILDGHTAEAGGLAYEAMFNVARRQLLQELNVICDSPLTFHVSYEKARHIATETGADLAVIECYCPDELEWSRRINARKALQLPTHHQTNWDAFQALRAGMLKETDYTIYDPHLKIDTARLLDDIVKEVLDWLNPAPRYDTIDRWEDPAGALRDLPETMLEELNQLRHAVIPTTPLEQDL